jgi:hypothetical protein
MDVQELDLIVKRRSDGRWAIHQRRGDAEPLIAGPLESRPDAETRAHTLRGIVGRDVFLEVTPGIRHKL